MFMILFTKIVVFLVESYVVMEHVHHHKGVFIYGNNKDMYIYYIMIINAFIHSYI